jgi:uncharacterized membrane protein
MKAAKVSTKNDNSQQQLLEEPKLKEPKLGQRVADAMAAKVGSWSFLIGQSTVLAAWVGINLTPGLPHWDGSPFILLNLVFSFASAYTAPIVLMSQNRQSDLEREKNEYDHLVNRQAAQNIELLHQKMDALQAHQLQEISRIIQEQQQCINEMKTSILPTFAAQSNYLKEIKVSDGKSANAYSVFIPLSVQQAIESNSKVFQQIIRREG